jgi:hypothetical protein
LSQMKIPAPLSHGLITIMQFLCIFTSMFRASVSDFEMLGYVLLFVESVILLFTLFRNVFIAVFVLGSKFNFSFEKSLVLFILYLVHHLLRCFRRTLSTLSYVYIFCSLPGLW